MQTKVSGVSPLQFRELSWFDLLVEKNLSYSGEFISLNWQLQEKSSNFCTSKAIKDTQKMPELNC